MNGILNLTSNQVTCVDELALAQVICSLSIAESKLENVFIYLLIPLTYLECLYFVSD